ncbi:MAG: glycosyltransferase [Syntrophales bacterium]|nr:glycosyltransferase [Syntrophales bacterium]
MKVAMLAPIAWRTPPRHYGPWEYVVSLLTEGLVEKGIDVTLFATGDSQTKGKLVSVCPRGYEEDKSILPKVWECLHISEVFERSNEFDIIHNHFDFLPLTYSGLTGTPVVTTIHGFSSPKILPVYQKYNNKTFYVAISEADKHPSLDYIATIHHGIDLTKFTFQKDPGDYLLFFGRIHHEKGTRECIEIAEKTGFKLIIAGIIQDEDYFNLYVKPKLNGIDIVYVGSAGPQERDRLLGGAYALLHPINFNEPFGLSVVEAMACGTPVIAINRGSMPEVIVDGVTGFLTTNVDEMLEKVPLVQYLDRSQCRLWVEERFSVDRMVNDYIKVYEKILECRKREDHRPWGFYEILSDHSYHKVKRITVYPGERLSYQRHKFRSEHWYVISGSGTVTIDGTERSMSPGDAVNIPVGAWHRIQNNGKDKLVFIEVQTGDYFGEDDIERAEDDYGRA